MSKGRTPRKRVDDAETAIVREPEARGEALLPPAAATAQTPVQPVLGHVVEALRFAAGAIVDLADAVADTITKQIASRRRS